MKSGDAAALAPAEFPMRDGRGAGIFAQRAARAAEILLALLLALVLGPVMLAIAVAVRILDGPPVLHFSRRVGQGGRRFPLAKFRTMRPGCGEGLAGGDRAGLISPLGRVLRRSRLDELPQLWNILRGDIGFVGPRPLLPEVASLAPELYARVLQARPGVTGLATLVFSAREERILATARSAEETAALYRARCIGRKARIDMIYARRRCLSLDLWLIALTAMRVIRRPGGRLPRRRGRQK